MSRNKNIVYRDKYECMLAFIEMMREAGAGGEVHGDLYFAKTTAKGLDPRIANSQSPALFRSFASTGAISLIKDKVFVSKRHGKNLLRVWKVTDKPLPKVVS